VRLAGLCPAPSNLCRSAHREHDCSATNESAHNKCERARDFFGALHSSLFIKIPPPKIGPISLLFVTVLVAKSLFLGGGGDLVLYLADSPVYFAPLLFVRARPARRIGNFIRWFSRGRVYASIKACIS